MAPKKARTSKDLLQLEHSNDSPAHGSKLLTICKAKKVQSTRPSFLCTMPLNGVLEESSVLRRVQAFLPVLDEANRKLAEAIKEKGSDVYDIEVLKSPETNAYVEMDLALGVADLRSDDAISAAERLAGGQVINTAPSRIEADSDGSSCDSSSEDESDATTLPMKREKRPKIETLS